MTSLERDIEDEHLGIENVSAGETGG